VAESLGIAPEKFAKIAHDLLANKGKGLVVAGGLNSEKSVQVAVNYLNWILGNEIHYSHASKAEHGSLSQLIKELNDKIKVN
jgi:hypothetical protein